MRLFPFLTFGIGASLLTLCLVGCSGDRESSGWAVNEGALALERDLLVSDTDSFYFGSVADLAVTSGGRMYVLDLDAGHVKVLGPDGSLQRTIGRKGQGPGEFQWAREMVVGRGDSLYVLEAERDRILVFAPSGALAYEIQAKSEGAVPDGLLVPRAHAGFLLLYTILPSSDAQGHGRFIVRRIDASERPADTILAVSPRDRFPIETPQVKVYMEVPYGRGPHLALGPGDELLFGRNDSLRLSLYALDGTQHASMSVPFDHVPVTREERAAELKDAAGKYRTIIDDRIPSTKPAFETLLVDDEGRYWFGRPTSHPDTTEWWIAQPEGKRLSTTRLRADIDLQAVRGGHAYGTTRTDTEAPAIVRYQVHGMR